MADSIYGTQMRPGDWGFGNYLKQKWFGMYGDNGSNNQANTDKTNVMNALKYWNDPNFNNVNVQGGGMKLFGNQNLMDLQKQYTSTLGANDQGLYSQGSPMVGSWTTSGYNPFKKKKGIGNG